MGSETEKQVWFGVGGLICGAVIAIIIGFAWLGWTTFSTTQEMSKQAVLAARAAICVAQFIKDPNYNEKLKEFEKLDSYGKNNTSDYVRKHGWDKMPGQEKTSPNVARVCAEGIEALIKK